MLSHAVLVGCLTVLGEGLTHDGDEHVQQVDTEGEGGKQEEQPEHQLLRPLTPSEIVIICAKFTKTHQIDVLHGANQLVVRRIFFHINVVKLDLILTNQVKSVSECTDGDDHGHNKVLNIREDPEDDVDQGSHLVDERHEVEALGPNEDGHDGFDDALGMLGRSVLTWF